MKTKGDPENARLLNRALILAELKKTSLLSRARLAELLNLSKMTVSAIVSDLIEENLIYEVGEGDSKSTGGRKPILLDLNETDRFVIGIDIGVTNTVVAIGNIKGKLLLRYRVPTRRNHIPKSIVSQIVELVKDLIHETKIDRSNIVGTGISIGGIIDKKKGNVVLSPDFNWKNIPLHSLLEAELGLPVVIDNCTRAMALGEKWYGNAKGIRNFFYVNIGYGIGSALVINHKIYDSNSEFGHITISNKEVKCDCGKLGCLEAVSSGHAIEKAAGKVFKAEKDKQLSAHEIATLAKSGNDEARKIFNESGKYLGRALAMVENLLNPEKIIIGGGISNSGDLLFEPLYRELKLYTMDVISESVIIEQTALGLDAGVIGAIALALDTYVFYSSRIIN